ncbi:hypothetical protein ACIFOT_08780 [Neobacillus sp. NRS-1170]|uniref:hypothetical protein n=1 Tax=Neobacillus sp. NRS-1170 TaxID=3233898 RepID=UPI003D265741
MKHPLFFHGIFEKVVTTVKTLARISMFSSVYFFSKINRKNWGIMLMSATA